VAGVAPVKRFDLEILAWGIMLLPWLISFLIVLSVVLSVVVLIVC